MSNSSSCSDISVASDDSEWNYIPGYLVIETENPTQSEDKDGDEVLEPYNDEPLADKEWTKEYKKRLAEKEKRDKMLNSRLEGVKPAENW